jgi:hypothetical protein
MDQIIDLFLSQGDTLKLLLAVVVAFWIIGAIFRLICHTIADLPRAASACFAVLFLYLISALVWNQGGNSLLLLRALPFWSQLFTSQGIYRLMKGEFSAFFVELCKLFVMIFVINLGQDLWIRRKKRNVFLWLGMEVGILLVALLANYGVDHLIATYLPDGFAAWFPFTLLGIIGLLLVLALVKLIFRLVNPILGVIFGFFSHNTAGRTLSKSVLTTLLLGIAVSVLRRLDYGLTLAQLNWPLSVAAPVLLIFLALWYLLWRILC